MKPAGQMLILRLFTSYHLLKPTPTTTSGQQCSTTGVSWLWKRRLLLRIFFPFKLETTRDKFHTSACKAACLLDLVKKCTGKKALSLILLYHYQCIGAGLDCRIGALGDEWWGSADSSCHRNHLINVYFPSSICTYTNKPLTTDEIKEIAETDIRLHHEHMNNHMGEYDTTRIYEVKTYFGR